MSGEGSVRDELVGHATLVLLALLGMALYATTYSLLFSLTPSAKGAVALVEMWLVTTHLASACACCAAQTVLVAVLQLAHPVPHIAEAQSALFLGLALAVTLCATACVGAGGDDACALYFGAAVLPRFAAVGAATWAWIVYLASLGCQTRTLALGADPTAAAVLVWVPWLAASTVVDVCGDGWRVLLCGGVRILAGGGVTADCGNLALGLWTMTLATLAAAGLSCAPAETRGGAVARVVGGTLLTAGAAIAWGAATPARVGTPTSFYIVPMALGLAGIAWELARLLLVLRKKKPAAFLEQPRGARTPRTAARFFGASLFAAGTRAADLSKMH